MSHAVELEVRHVHLATEPTAFADVVVADRASVAPRGLRVRISYGDGHQLAHEMQGQETPRSHAIVVMGTLLETIGGRLTAAHLHADAAGHLCAALRVDMPTGHVEVTVSPGHALAVAVRLGVQLLGDHGLFDADMPEPLLQPARDSISAFLESLDLSGLGS